MINSRWGNYMHEKSPGQMQQISDLSDQLEQLSQRVTLLEQAAVKTKAPTPDRINSVAAPKEEMGPSLLIDSSSLLKHVSVLCFLLVIALGLRTLMDNEMLNLQLGLVLGSLYAGSLIVCSHLFYRRSNSLAPVFSITGALLMFSVIIETHAHFAALPEELGYVMLAATGIGLAAISYLNRVALPIIVGTLGMCLSAVALGYPAPHFPYLALILWASNLLGFFATRLKRCSWLRWLLLFTTHFMLQIWGLRLSGVMLYGQGKTENLFPGLFIPVVILIGFTFMMIALFGIIRTGDDKVSRFDFSLPAVNASWCYVSAIYALKNPAVFAWPAAAAAAIHFALAYWLSRRDSSNAQGTNTFTTGGLILACLSLPALLGNIIFSLPILAILALATCYFSCRWSSGGMRITSYLLQTYVAIVLLFEFIGGITAQHQSPIILCIIATCSVIPVAHYYYARKTSPPVQSLIFGRYDKQDQSALLPLFAGLISAFFTSMLIASHALRFYYPEDMSVAFTATQSIIINLAAIFIMVRAFFRENSELRNVAIFILVIGGCKVFVIDMLNISGEWLVCSIFTFGIAAALESLILARWKTATHSHPQTTENKPVRGKK